MASEELGARYLRWRDSQFAPFVAKKLGFVNGRAEVADLHATLGRLLGVERPHALETRVRVKHCSCAYCRENRSAPRHGPYTVKEFWDPTRGKAGAWRVVPKGRKGFVRQRQRDIPPDELPRAATMEDLAKLRGALVED